MENIIPDFLKVPLAFAALEVPTILSQKEKEKQAHEEKMKLLEQQRLTEEQTLKSIWSW